MTLLVVLAVLLPWSLSRQMHEHEVTRKGLIRLPLVFTGIGLLGLGTQDIPTHGAAVAYVVVSFGLSITLSAWRGAVIPVWRDAAGRWKSKGNRLTVTLWGALIAGKVAMGTVAHLRGWFPAEGTSEVFLFLGISFGVHSLIVARRSILRGPVPSPRPEKAY